VRGVTTTFAAGDNLAFASKTAARLAKLDTKWSDRIDIGYTLDPAKVAHDRKSPSVIVAAANASGEIVRYFEAGETAAYFGSPFARNTATGLYDLSRESRMVASTGKIIAAIAIANTRRDTTQSLYVDAQAPESGLETCRRGSKRHGRKAIVSFACSLNDPLLRRTARVGQRSVRKIIDQLGFTMPPPNSLGEGTPPSTAVVLGQVAAAPRRVHQLAGTVLGSLIGRGSSPVPLPSLVKTYDYTNLESAAEAARAGGGEIIPDKVIKRGGRALLRDLLQAPLCYRAGGRAVGTLKSLHAWCAPRRKGLRLHFAKTGTQVTEDPNATVDAWIAGGLQFTNGAAYSYVVVVGTGSVREPWARRLHSSQVAAPLLEVLLTDLEEHAKANPRPDLAPRRRRRTPTASVSRQRAPSMTAADELNRNLNSN
jgi:hypothetical protein